MIMNIFGFILSIICLGTTGLNSDMAAEDANQLLASPVIEAMMEQAAPEKAAVEAVEAAEAEPAAVEAVETAEAEPAAVQATRSNEKLPYGICYRTSMDSWSKDCNMDYDQEGNYYHTQIEPNDDNVKFKIKVEDPGWIANQNWGGTIYYDNEGRGICFGVADGEGIPAPSGDAFEVKVKFETSGDTITSCSIFVNRDPLIKLHCALQSTKLATIPLTYNQEKDYYSSEIKPSNDSDAFRLVVPGNAVTNWGGHIDYVDETGKCNAVPEGQWITVPSSSKFYVYVRYFSDNDVEIYVNIEPRDPNMKTVTVNINGGELTDAKMEEIKSNGWNFDTKELKPTIFYKDVAYGKTYKEVMDLWTKITPEHESWTFAGWDPSLTSATEITKDTTFTALWEINEHKVSVVIGDATLREEDTKKVEADGWAIDKEAAAFTYAKSVEAGKTYAEAMNVWGSVYPQPKDATSKFEGWDPEFDETVIVQETDFKAVYSEPIPESAVVTVDLDSGTITKEEADYLENNDWKIQKDENNPRFTKQVQLGITYKEAMQVWIDKVSPTKTDYNFKGWNPEADRTKITKDITFTAQWESEGPEPPVPTTYLVSVDLSGGLITEEESGALIEDGWDLAPDENILVFSKEFEKGTTYQEALKVWVTISPTKEDFTFEGWDPTPDSTQLSEAKTFTAVYKAYEPDPPGPGPDPDPDPGPDVPVNPEQGTTAVSYIAKTADSIPYAIMAFALLTAIICSAVLAYSKHN